MYNSAPSETLEGPNRKRDAGQEETRRNAPRRSFNSAPLAAVFLLFFFHGVTGGSVLAGTDKKKGKKNRKGCPGRHGTRIGSRDPSRGEALFMQTSVRARTVGI